MPENQTETFQDILHSFDTAMLITRSGEGLSARPMIVADMKGPASLLFLADENAQLTEEIKMDPRVHVTCQRDHGCYVSISGQADISTDQSKIESVWREAFRTWFPEGKRDPKIVLITVKADRGEYWDERRLNRVKNLFDSAHDYFSGEESVTKGVEHGEIRT